MANPTIQTNANGIVSSEILELIVLGNQAVEKGVIKIIPGVQDKIELPRMSISDNIIQDRDATPSNSVGTLARTGRTITPLDGMVYYRFNPRMFETDWREFQPKGRFPDKVTNPKMLKAMMSVTKKSINNQIGNLIWSGDITAGAASPLRFFNGLVTIAAADAEVIDVTNIGVITKANVIAVFEAVRNSIPDAILDQQNLRFHISTAVKRLYQDAVRELSFKGSDPTTTTASLFMDIEVIDFSGFPANTVYAAVSSTGSDSNFYAAVDMAGDEDNIKMQQYRPESEEWFAKALFKMATNIAWPQETVLYQGS